MARSHPSKGFVAREQHRGALVLHALLMIVGLGACTVVNRMRSPGTLWVQWVALAWLCVFGVHLWVFARGTLATMGGGKRER